MGIIKINPPVKFFTAITFKEDTPLKRILNKLEQILSPIDTKSPAYAFDQFTDYYQPEMGVELQKQMISFLEIKPAETIVEIKIATNKIEDEFSENKRRTVNIDPGYICAAKMILATTKDYDHRIYLNRGIFGDVHLRFRQGHFTFNEWTYPDYRQEQITSYFEKLRGLYLEQLKNWNLD